MGSSNKFGTMLLLFDLVGLLAVILLFILYWRKTKKLKKMLKNMNAGERKAEEELAVGDDVETSGLDDEKGKLVLLEEETRFELSHLLKASAEGLGKGVFGNSYKAKIQGMPAVVVKRLKDLKALSSEEFMKQLSRIADQKHPNLLPLVAYYYSNHEKLMVHRFAPKGNLFNLIHGERGKANRIPFRWNARLSVARGVARALEYLHLNNSQSIVPHGNLKSSNVLLDENETPLVSDYGLISLIALPIASTRMASFKSPEYQTLKRVTKKSDVWSYGCLLLELLTGRVSAHSAPPGTNGVDLCSWVHRAVREEWTAEIFDLEISVQRNAASGMLRLLQIAIQCCNKAPEKRPEMKQVVREVDNIEEVESDEENLSSSLDHSLTDESHSTSASAIIGDQT
ncbi:probable inactive receptor kinase At2g26730 [Mercurialis annua]|uniref:probable inactive receptor kinase At2g26730 n=1 Tax=Mercurialis annua TaxID=3986 RepID=UPI002160A6B9|nr:probable inactive receptor kinase At2g26730 [Mercurialis annua]